MTTDKQIHAAFTEVADALARADDVLADYAEEHGATRRTRREARPQTRSSPPSRSGRTPPAWPNGSCRSSTPFPTARRNAARRGQGAAVESKGERAPALRPPARRRGFS
jgi:hypothetical protein